MLSILASSTHLYAGIIDISDPLGGGVWQRPLSEMIEGVWMQEESSMHEVKIFPNPSNGLFHLEVGGDSALRSVMDVRVMNLLGETVFKKCIDLTAKESSSYSIDIGMMPAGVYFLSLQKGNDMSTRKLIKN